MLHIRQYLQKHKVILFLMKCCKNRFGSQSVLYSNSSQQANEAVSGKSKRLELSKTCNVHSYSVTVIYKTLWTHQPLSTFCMAYSWRFSRKIMLFRNGVENGRNLCIYNHIESSRAICIKRYPGRYWVIYIFGIATFFCVGWILFHGDLSNLLSLETSANLGLVVVWIWFDWCDTNFIKFYKRWTSYRQNILWFWLMLFVLTYMS